eukprot:CFRG1653T1
MTCGKCWRCVGAMSYAEFERRKLQIHQQIAEIPPVPAPRPKGKSYVQFKKEDERQHEETEVPQRSAPRPAPRSKVLNFNNSPAFSCVHPAPTAAHVTASVQLSYVPSHVTAKKAHTPTPTRVANLPLQNPLPDQDRDRTETIGSSGSGDGNGSEKSIKDTSASASLSIEDEHVLFEKCYRTGMHLGNGAFGMVKKCYPLKSRDSNEVYAVKIIDRKKFKLKPKVQSALEREVAIMKRCSHPGVLRYIDFFEDNKAIYIVMEFVDGDDLSGYIDRLGTLSETQCKVIFRPLLEAVRYLHGEGIAHRDIKPANILLSLSADFEVLAVKVADFGFAKRKTQENQWKTQIGTPAYTAPEIRQGGNEYDLKVDMWALGVMLYEMLCGTQPFQQHEEKVVSFSEPIWKSVSLDVKELIMNLLEYDPANRLGAGESLSHPWFRQ